MTKLEILWLILAMSKHLDSLILMAFNIVWALIAMMAQDNHSTFALIIALAFCGIVFWLKKFSLNTILKLLVLVLVGLGFDSMLIFKSTAVPLWLVAIWLGFVFTLPSYLPLFSQRLWLAAPFAGFFAPISYAVAEKMQLLQVTSSLTWIIMIIFWCCYFPLALVVLRPKVVGVFH